MNPSDEERRRGLRRMKTVATALLLVTVVVYVATLHQGGALGFVNAAAEAGMVGALADWFAVTALFRHPLGLPVPHTAIIPTRKEALGRSLQSFVATNFLAEDVVRAKVLAADVPGRVGRWLTARENAQRVSDELASAARAAIRVLRDDDVQAVIEQAVVRKARAQQWGPPAGRLLADLVRHRAHHRLVDLAVDRLYAWVLDNRERLEGLVLEQAPSWSPRFVDRRVANHVYEQAVRILRDIHTDPEHEARTTLDAMLAHLAEELQTDPYTIDQVERLKEKLLAQSDVREAVAAVWSAVRRMLVEAVEAPDSELRRRVTDNLVAFGERLDDEEDLRAKLCGWLAQAVGHVVANYRDEVATVISDTVRRWDANEASRRIELHVGRDLQFIRINGTVVGSLAGLAIHAVTVAIG